MSNAPSGSGRPAVSESSVQQDRLLNRSGHFYSKIMFKDVLCRHAALTWDDRAANVYSACDKAICTPELFRREFVDEERYKFVYAYATQTQDGYVIVTYAVGDTYYYWTSQEQVEGFEINCQFIVCWDQSEVGRLKKFHPECEMLCLKELMWNDRYKYKAEFFAEVLGINLHYEMHNADWSKFTNAHAGYLLQSITAVKLYGHKYRFELFKQTERARSMEGVIKQILNISADGPIQVNVDEQAGQASISNLNPPWSTNSQDPVGTQMHADDTALMNLTTSQFNLYYQQRFKRDPTITFKVHSGRFEADINHHASIFSGFGGSKVEARLEAARVFWFRVVLNRRDAMPSWIDGEERGVAFFSI